MSKPKLAIVCTHPIQYYAPVFRALSASDRVVPRVFYTYSQAAGDGLYDAGFGKEIKWDIPLLEGYDHQFVHNAAKRPGLDRFSGLNTPSLSREIQTWAPDALLIYTWNSRAHLGALRYFKGRLPVLFRGDSTLIDHRIWWRALARRMVLTWVYSHVDIAIAVGSNNRDYFRWCGLSPNRIALAPHSIDTVRFAADDETSAAVALGWRREMGIDAGALVFLFAGKLQAKKNPELLLRAFGALRDGSHLVFAGNGELEGDLKAKAKSLPNVHFMPFQNQSAMPALYRLGDVFVLPSQGPEETWGLAMNEAMASGRAVIASTKVGGAIDVIRPGENGWMFPSGDSTALENLLRIAAERGRAGLLSMGRTAQKLSVNWSSEESARRIADAVLASLTRAPSPSLRGFGRQ